jgi:hypothetical protein
MSPLFIAGENPVLKEGRSGEALKLVDVYEEVSAFSWRYVGPAKGGMTTPSTWWPGER